MKDLKKKLKELLHIKTWADTTRPTVFPYRQLLDGTTIFTDDKRYILESDVINFITGCGT
jgi:hypothetical protein